MTPLLLATGLLLAGQVSAGAQAAAPPVPATTPAVTCETKNPDSTNGTVSFDTKGVEFGPWVRRFANRVKRNWFVPAEALASKGCAIYTVRLLKNGVVADVMIVNPSEVPAFTQAGYNALLRSSPFEPLPAGYPDDSVTITITFYYNQPSPNTTALPSTPPSPPPPPDFASQPEPTAPPARAHGHSATFKLAGTSASDPIDLLRWFATGKPRATGAWLVEHQHGGGPGSAFCRGLLSLSGERLVFRSENLSEGFVATAEEVTTVNRRQDAGTFTISFR